MVNQLHYLAPIPRNILYQVKEREREIKNLTGELETVILLLELWPESEWVVGGQAVFPKTPQW